MKGVGKSDSKIWVAGKRRDVREKGRVDGWSVLCKTFSSFDKCGTAATISMFCLQS